VSLGARRYDGRKCGETGFDAGRTKSRNLAVFDIRKNRDPCRCRIEPEHCEQLESGHILQIQTYDDEIRFEGRNGRVRLIGRVDEFHVVRSAVEHRLDDREGVCAAADKNGELPVGVARKRVSRHIDLAYWGFKKRASP